MKSTCYYKTMIWNNCFSPNKILSHSKISTVSYIGYIQVLSLAYYMVNYEYYVAM